MAENQVPAFFKEAWNNWCTGTDYCFECPNRDNQCRVYPKFGEGVLDGEIAFVAETPNETRERQHSSESRIERFGKFENKVRSNPIPGWIKKGNRFANSFFEDISADFSNNRERGIYYTNIKKCADIDDSRSKWKNLKAKRHCERYLRDELQTVDPEIVITFGEEATDSFFEVFDIDRSVDQMKNEVLNTHHVGSYKMIPSFHWSYLHLNIRSLDRIEDKQDYWEALAEKINTTIEA